MTLPIMPDAKVSAARLNELAAATARSSTNPTPTSLTNPQLVVPNGKLNSKRSDPNVGEGAQPRRSSPESAVTSSDEEADQSKLGYLPNNKLNGISQFSSRRPSYAAEFHTRQRTYSITGDGGPLSPTTSHPNAPSGDTAAWAAGVTAKSSGVPTSGTSIGALWSPSIWNNEPARKSPPKSLSMGGANPNSLFSGSEALPSPTSMSNGSEFPIPIPLQPTYRNFRSMSFSVGQMEVDEQNRQQRRSPPSHVGAQRAPNGLQHRPSRPSLLSEEQFPGPSSPLRIVNESEDDEFKELSQSRTATGGFFPGQVSGFPRTKYDALRFRNRSASAATIPSLGLGSANGLGASGLGANGIIDEYESAVAEEDDWDLAQFQAEQRRFSEAAPRAMSLMYSPTENQRLDALRRQHWASVGGGFAPPEGSQSRRHSFAGPMADASETEYGLPTEYLAKRATNIDNGVGSNGRGNNYLSLTDVSNFDNSRNDPMYPNEENRLRPRQSFSSTQPPTLQQPNGVSPNHHHTSMGGYGERHSPPSAAQRSMMGMSVHTQSRGQQLLYFVTFKACRGDVFYVQEGTGLRVRTGDLVIVEADRGTDLGTVAYENITWAKAKELKEQFAKEQYNVLMMYASRRATPGAPTTAASSTMNMNGSPPSFMNGNAGQGHGHLQGQDTTAAELKPKMIKRLAQPHEIQTLRDKEANEAKAKRVCQQKVLEHRLPMEILDAEFQMDWKKLTFYYFAENYINFNPLVTDLFKVYKTRIWMSAMNPASFAHGPGSGPVPGGAGSLGNGLSTIGEAPKDAAPQNFAGLNPNYNGFAAPLGSSMGHNGVGVPRGFSQQMPPHIGSPASMAGFPSRHSPQSMEHQFGLHGYVNGFGGIVPGFAVPGGILGGSDPLAPNGVDQTWMGMQGLSLNTN